MIIATESGTGREVWLNPDHIAYWHEDTNSEGDTVTLVVLSRARPVGLHDDRNRSAFEVLETPQQLDEAYAASYGTDLVAEVGALQPDDVDDAPTPQERLDARAFLETVSDVRPIPSRAVVRQALARRVYLRRAEALVEEALDELRTVTFADDDDRCEDAPYDGTTLVAQEIRADTADEAEHPVTVDEADPDHTIIP